MPDIELKPYTPGNADPRPDPAAPTPPPLSGGELAGAEILFRRLDAPVASWSEPGCRWVVELWIPDMAYPIAQAWVLDNTGNALASFHYLDWLHVMEEYRRKGAATKLLDAARGRWPELLYDGATPAGDGFVDAYDARSAGPDDAQTVLDYLRGDDEPDAAPPAPLLTDDQRAELKTELMKHYRDPRPPRYGPLGDVIATPAPVTPAALFRLGFVGDGTRIGSQPPRFPDAIMLCFSFEPFAGEATPRAWLQYVDTKWPEGSITYSNIPIPMPADMGEVLRLVELLKIKVGI